MDCQSCGACCSSILVVDVYWLDEGVPEKMVKDDRLFGRVMRERRGRCIALRGEMGCSVKCSIYDVRPSVCRDFAPGSDLCLLVRRRAGIQEDEPLLHIQSALL